MSLTSFYTEDEPIKQGRKNSPTYTKRLDQKDHFTVVCLVAWPLDESETGVDLVLIETSLLFFANDAVLMLISRNLHNKSSEVSIKTRSTPALLSFNGQATKHTTVKWSILNFFGCHLMLLLFCCFDY